MFKLLTKLPKNLSVACSGGVDSMALLDFLRLRHNVTVCFFHHGTETSYHALNFLSTYCRENSLAMRVDFLVEDCPKSLSMEEHWRNSRYALAATCSLSLVCSSVWRSCFLERNTRRIASQKKLGSLAKRSSSNFGAASWRWSNKPRYDHSTCKRSSGFVLGSF